MNNKQQNSTNPKWLNKVEIVFAIVFVILLVGLIFYFLKDRSKKEPKKPTKEELKKNRLEEVQERIKILEPKKEQLEKTERKYFLFARLVIGAILLTINGLYLYFDNLKDFSLGDQLNINGGIVLIYSFVAFLLYGSPNALVKAIKTRASQIFLRNHIHVLTELEDLQKEEKEILLFLKEIDDKKKLEEATIIAVSELKLKADNKIE